MKRAIMLIAAVLTAVVLCAVFAGCAPSLSGLYDIGERDIARDASLTLDGVKTKSARIKGSGEHTLTMTWDSPVSFDTVVLREKSGNKIDKISIFIDGSSVPAYEQDEVGKLREAYLGDTTATSVAVKISEADGNYDISSVEVYDMPRERNDFRVFSYIVLGKDGSEFDALDLGSAEHITDAVLFGDTELGFNEKGELKINSDTVRRAVTKLRERNAGLRIHAALLPSPDDASVSSLEWPKNVVATHEGAFASGAFADNVAEFVREFGLDGVGFDYEYPGTSAEFGNYGDFLEKMDGKLPDGVQLTCAIPINSHKMPKKVWKTIDNALVMSYDFIGRYNAHSNYSDGAVYALEVAAQMGIPKSKTIPGIPFYSRPNMTKDKWNLVSYWGDYKTDYLKLGKFTNMLKIDEKRPILWQDEPMLLDSLYYNCYQMVCDKTALFYDYGAGGVMIWNYGADVPYSDPMSLHRAVCETARI